MTTDVACNGDEGDAGPSSSVSATLDSTSDALAGIVLYPSAELASQVPLHRSTVQTSVDEKLLPRFFLGCFSGDSNFLQSKVGKAEIVVISERAYTILEIMFFQG
jgi:hypothetical protein